MIPFVSRSVASPLLIGLVLGACTPTASTRPAPPPGAVAGVTPSTFAMPSGSGCASEIARFRAVLRNDLETGHVGQGVYDRAGTELSRGEAACAAGRDGEGRSILASTKARFGYP